MVLNSIVSWELDLKRQDYMLTILGKEPHRLCSQRQARWACHQKQYGSDWFTSSVLGGNNENFCCLVNLSTSMILINVLINAENYVRDFEMRCWQKLKHPINLKVRILRQSLCLSGVKKDIKNCLQAANLNQFHVGVTNIIVKNTIRLPENSPIV